MAILSCPKACTSAWCIARVCFRRARPPNEEATDRSVHQPPTVGTFGPPARRSVGPPKYAGRGPHHWAFEVAPNLPAQWFCAKAAKISRSNCSMRLDCCLLPFRSSTYCLPVSKIPVNMDNDCSSDEEEVQQSIKHMLMSLCIAAYDNRLN